MKKENVLRYSLSLCFFLSGALKAMSIRAFEQELQLYGDAYIADWVHDYSLWIAIMVCIYEISLAILALFGKFARLASVLFCISLMFFTYLTGVNLFFPGLLGSIESCGCFGELIHFSPLASFVKSLLLLGVSVLGIMVCRKSANDN